MEHKMNTKTFLWLNKMLARLIVELGLKNRLIVPTPGVITIDGSGVSIIWSEKGHLNKLPGWVVKESYEIMDVEDGLWKPMTTTITTGNDDDWQYIAKFAIMTLLERKIDIIISREKK